jgi:hypothetical protein
MGTLGEPGMSMEALIHIVDDDESTLTALVRLLRANGFEAIGHASAGEFLLHRPADRSGCRAPLAFSCRLRFRATTFICPWSS